MRHLVPVLLFLASPVVAHPSEHAHSHAADWTVPVALLLIGVAAVVAQRLSAWARK